MPAKKAKKVVKKKVKKTKYPKIKRRSERLVIQDGYGGLVDKDARHVKERFKVRKKKNVDGSIDIKLIPYRTLQKQRRELIGKIAPVLAKEVDSEALMRDVLEDVDIENLEKLGKALKRGAKIKPKEGCFYLDIKDPRKKKSYRLPIRN